MKGISRFAQYLQYIKEISLERRAVNIRFLFPNGYGAIYKVASDMSWPLDDEKAEHSYDVAILDKNGEILYAVDKATNKFNIEKERILHKVLGEEADLSFEWFGDIAEKTVNGHEDCFCDVEAEKLFEKLMQLE